MARELPYGGWRRLCVKDNATASLLDAWCKVDGSSLRVKFDDDVAEIDADHPELLIQAVKNAHGDQSSLVCCVDCVQFEQSGMSREMGCSLSGQCKKHCTQVEVCFLCDDFASQDRFRPLQDPGKPDLSYVKHEFMHQLVNDQAFVIFEYGSILIEDPHTKSGHHRCTTTLPSLINVLPSISISAHDDCYIAEHHGFVYSVVSKDELSRGEQYLHEVMSVFCEERMLDCPSLRLPTDSIEMCASALSWSRLVKDMRACKIGLVHSV